MCPIWGETENDTENVKGIMSLENARKILDEVMAAKPLVHPALYGEPTLAPAFKEIIKDCHSKGMTVAINSNGLAINKQLAEYIVKYVDSISISIDDATPDTLKKIRGIDNLPKIENAVEHLLQARGSKRVPRIGVSFTTQDQNRHELDDFINKWTPIVDVVRIGNLFKDGYFQGFETPKERIPCGALWLTMPIHNDGSVTICCLDSWRKTNMGNVFENSVADIWKGNKFQEVRKLHEEGRWDDLPICKKCNGWVQFSYEEEIVNNLLIRRNPEFTYYNRIDMLDNWSKELKEGHCESLAPTKGSKQDD